MVNAWIKTVKEVQASVPKKTLLKDILEKAKQIYVKKNKKNKKKKKRKVKTRRKGGGKRKRKKTMKKKL